jgi:hypothetical protein
MHWIVAKDRRAVCDFFALNKGEGHPVEPKQRSAATSPVGFYYWQKASNSSSCEAGVVGTAWQANGRK